MFEYLFLQQLFQGRFQKKRGIFIEAILEALFGDFDLMAPLGFHRKIVQALIFKLVAIKNNQIEKHAALDLAIRSLGEADLSGKAIEFLVTELCVPSGVQIFGKFGE